jgi:hypothetical protein
MSVWQPSPPLPVYDPLRRQLEQDSGAVRVSRVACMMRGANLIEQGMTVNFPWAVGCGMTVDGVQTFESDPALSAEVFSLVNTIMGTTEEILGFVRFC